MRSFRVTSVHEVIRKSKSDFLILLLLKNKLFFNNSTVHLQYFLLKIRRKKHD
jgi:hypothetical protein